VRTSIHTPPNWLDPLDWTRVFTEPHPIEIDVGAGKGAFLLWSAQDRPHVNFLGVERQLGRLRKIDRKVRRLGLENIRLIRIEAGYLIGRLIPKQSVAAYHIYFPDPWPKRRHHRRRLFTIAFVRDLHRTLQSSGAVHIATDFEDYFAQIQGVMRESNGFFEVSPASMPEAAKTDYEREFLAAGRAVFRSRWDTR
jgi:tRNA (guanine-N7-)-methyltransferase